MNMKAAQKCRRVLVLALVLALVFSSSALAADKAEGPALEEAALAAAQTAMTASGAESISWALWADGEVVLSGDLSAGKGPQQGAVPGGVYGIGSVSKMFTTVAVMQLAEQGKLSLDAPVTRYLPEFRMADSRYKKITVRMLLNHSSGLLGSSIENAMLFDDADSAAKEGLLERLSQQRLKAEPGAYSVYCNDGFTLAELVVEALAGRDFMDHIRSSILSPAELDAVYAPGEKIPGLVRAYGGGTRALPQDCLNLLGTGGLYATAADLASFGGMLTGTGLLRQSSLDAMAYPEYSRGIWPEDTLDAMAFGLGWDHVAWYPFSQSGITALVKGGDTLYYHAGLVVIPEYHMAAAVLSSGGVSAFNELAATQMLLKAMEERGVTVDQSVPALPEAAPAPMPAEVMENAGYYGASAAQYQVEISADGVLSLRCLTLPSLPSQTFTYCDDGSFRDAAGTIAVRLVEEENGETYFYQKAVTSIPGLGALPSSNYMAVKIEENPLPEQVADIWESVYEASVLPVTEKYSSQVYLALSNSAGMELPKQVPGYIGAARIVDETSAQYQLQIPGNSGRDGMDWMLLEKDGARWVQVNGTLYMPEAAAPDIYTGSGWSYATIGQEGYARWYHIGDAAGKTMTVQLPETAGFWVYDAKGQVTASSVVWDDVSAQLPEEGLVVFAGDAGDRFHLSFQ